MKKEDFLIKDELVKPLQILGVFDKFLTNVTQDCSTVQDLFKKVRSINSYPSTNTGIKALIGSEFSWVESPEGFEYWKKVYFKINES